MAARAEPPRLRLLLDEMCSPAMADRLRRKGLDVVAALERDDLRGLDDESLLTLARTERRVLATFDVGDFAALATRSQGDDPGHHGLILISPRRFSASLDGVGALVRALERVIRERPGYGGLVNTHLWLGAD